MAEFDPWGAAATYVGAKAKENPACSDADTKLLESIDGHGSEKNFQSLGKAIDAAGDTVEKLEKTSKHHAEIAKNEKEKAEDALAAKRAQKDLDAEKSAAADDLKRIGDQIEGVASAQVAHQEDGRGARLRGEERAQVMRRLRVLEASRGVRKSGIPIASRGLPPPEGTSFVNVLFRTTNYRSNRNRPVVVASARETSPGPTARTVSVPGATSVLPASATRQCGRPAFDAASRSAASPSCGAATTIIVSPAPAHRSMTVASARRREILFGHWR